jgi:hypothetical protein
MQIQLDEVYMGLRTQKPDGIAGIITASPLQFCHIDKTI